MWVPVHKAVWSGGHTGTAALDTQRGLPGDGAPVSCRHLLASEGNPVTLLTSNCSNPLPWLLLEIRFPLENKLNRTRYWLWVCCVSVGVERKRELVPSVQFCCKPRTALKKVCNKKKQTPKLNGIKEPNVQNQTLSCRKPADIDSTINTTGPSIW